MEPKRVDTIIKQYMGQGAEGIFHGLLHELDEEIKILEDFLKPAFGENEQTLQQEKEEKEKNKLAMNKNKTAIIFIISQILITNKVQNGSNANMSMSEKDKYLDMLYSALMECLNGKTFKDVQGNVRSTIEKYNKKEALQRLKFDILVALEAGCDIENLMNYIHPQNDTDASSLETDDEMRELLQKIRDSKNEAGLSDEDFDSRVKKIQGEKGLKVIIQKVYENGLNRDNLIAYLQNPQSISLNEVIADDKVEAVEGLLRQIKRLQRESGLDDTELRSIIKEHTVASALEESIQGYFREFGRDEAVENTRKNLQGKKRELDTKKRMLGTRPNEVDSNSLYSKYNAAVEEEKKVAFKLNCYVRLKNEIENAMQNNGQSLKSVRHSATRAIWHGENNYISRTILLFINGTLGLNASSIPSDMKDELSKICWGAIYDVHITSIKKEVQEKANKSYNKKIEKAENKIKNIKSIEVESVESSDDSEDKKDPIVWWLETETVYTVDIFGLMKLVGDAKHNIAPKELLDFLRNPASSKKKQEIEQLIGDDPALTLDESEKRKRIGEICENDVYSSALRVVLQAKGVNSALDDITKYIVAEERAKIIKGIEDEIQQKKSEIEAAELKIFNEEPLPEGKKKVQDNLNDSILPIIKDALEEGISVKDIQNYLLIGVNDRKINYSILSRKKALEGLNTIHGSFNIDAEMINYLIALAQQSRNNERLQQLRNLHQDVDEATKKRVKKMKLGLEGDKDEHAFIKYMRTVVQKEANDIYKKNDKICFDFKMSLPDAIDKVTLTWQEKADLCSICLGNRSARKMLNRVLTDLRTYSKRAVRVKALKREKERFIKTTKKAKKKNADKNWKRWERNDFKDSIATEQILASDFEQKFDAKERTAAAVGATKAAITTAEDEIKRLKMQEGIQVAAGMQTNLANVSRRRGEFLDALKAAVSEAEAAETAEKNANPRQPEEAAK